MRKHSLYSNQQRQRDRDTPFFPLFFLFVFFCCGLLQCLPHRAVVFNFVCTACECVCLQSIFKRCVGCVFALHVAVFVGEYWVAYTVLYFFVCFLSAVQRCTARRCRLSFVRWFQCAFVFVCFCLRLVGSRANIYFSVLLFSSNAEVARGVVFRCKQQC